MKKEKLTKGTEDGFLMWLSNLLTNHQKYYTMIIIVTLGFSMIVYGLITEYNKDFSLLGREVAGNKIEQVFHSLYEKIERHAFVLMRFYEGSKLAKGEARKIEATINNDFRILEGSQEDLTEILSYSNSFLTNQSGDPISIEDLEKTWREIEKSSFEGDVGQLRKQHALLLADLSAIMKQLEEAVNPSETIDVIIFRLGELVNGYFPVFVRDLIALTSMSNDAEVNPTALTEQIAMTRANFQIIKELTDSAIEYLQNQPGQESKLQEIRYAFSNFEGTIEQYLYRVSQSQINPVGPNDEAILKATFLFWRELRALLLDILKERHAAVTNWTYPLLFGSLFITVFGVIIGKFFVRSVAFSIKSLDLGFKKLNGGDLTARVPVQFEDEIGRSSMAFNIMAQKFEGILTQMRHLFDATKRLSEGDFSTRVAIEEEGDSEVNKLTHSFNNMASFFENIVREVGRLGVNLTASTKEIANAADNHETSLGKQEEATREVLGISGEISKSAKEFADSISEVTRVMEQTALMALKGRDSLNHMQKIMKLMVRASTDIASKLGVLNEKAGNINSVITTITNVADQTNLLSLNAAIIADKSGEDGRSFSIIAGEIRNLADRTALATLDIEKIVEEMLKAVTASVLGVDDFIQEIKVGVEQNDRVGGQLAKIIEQVQALAPQFEVVNEGMKGQFTASRQIDESIRRLSGMTHHTAEALHRFSVITADMKESALFLEKAISKIEGVN